MCFCLALEPCMSLPLSWLHVRAKNAISVCFDAQAGPELAVTAKLKVYSVISVITQIDRRYAGLLPSFNKR